MAFRIMRKSAFSLPRVIDCCIKRHAATTVSVPRVNISFPEYLPKINSLEGDDSSGRLSNGPLSAGRFGYNLGALRRRTLFMEASTEQILMHDLKDTDSGISLLILNRPEVKNALGTQLVDKLNFFLKKVQEDSSARVLLICSSVPRAFCAGADLKERRKMDETEVHKYVTRLRSTFKFLEVLPIPTLAVVEGAALGGGLELALACDLRVCGAEAVFAMPETSLAIIPGAGGTHRLPRLVGRSRAKDLIFTARRIDAEEATHIGLVDYCVPAGDAYTKALDIARTILQQGPVAIKMAKAAIDRGLEADVSRAPSIEEECYSQVLRTKDRLEALDAFAQKRIPIYTGR